MIQRLVVASLGTALVVGMMGMGQVQRRGRQQRSSAADQQTAQGQDLASQADTQTEKGTDSKTDSENDKPAKGDEKTAKKSKPKIEQATFGGGCFWCMEAVFERIPGVQSVVSGFAGGRVPNPTYQIVCTGLTGHAEVVQITYDPSVVSYEKLLDFFWISHDPTTPNAQGPDYGTQYRSIILYHDEDQREAAIKSYKQLKARRGRRSSPIVTQLVPLEAFYPAEPYHQDYYNNHPDEQYSQIYIEPKIKKLAPKFKQAKQNH
jgi:peptide-methionine (S)-S-oxide reductase